MLMTCLLSLMCNHFDYNDTITAAQVHTTKEDKLGVNTELASRAGGGAVGPDHADTNTLMHTASVERGLRGDKGTVSVGELSKSGVKVCYLSLCIDVMHT
jgi:hypothetical protein